SQRCPTLGYLNKAVFDFLAFHFACQRPTALGVLSALFGIAGHVSLPIQPHTFPVEGLFPQILVRFKIPNVRRSKKGARSRRPSWHAFKRVRQDRGEDAYPENKSSPVRVPSL